MDRRRFAGAVVTGIVPVVGGCTGGRSGNYVPVTEFYGSHAVAYHSDSLRLRPQRSSVAIGDTIGFDVTNTGDSSITLGCGNPTTIQKEADGRWKDVVWTSAKGMNSCATVLEGHDTRTERLTLSKRALQDRSDEVRLSLDPGRYRLVVLSTDPYLAANFRLRH